MIGFSLTDEQLELRGLARRFAERELRPSRPVGRARRLPAGAPRRGRGAGAHELRHPGAVRRRRLRPRHPGRSWPRSWPGAIGACGCLRRSGAVRGADRPGRDARAERPLAAAQVHAGGRAGRDRLLGAARRLRPRDHHHQGRARRRRLRPERREVVDHRRREFADAILVFATLDPEPGRGGSRLRGAGRRARASRPGKKDLHVGLKPRTRLAPSRRRPRRRRPLLGGEGEGSHGHALLLLLPAQVAAAAVGVARAAFEHAGAYANEREAFGAPIAELQGVSFLLADMGMRSRGRAGARLAGLPPLDGASTSGSRAPRRRPSPATWRCA